ncbi:centromere protein X isoform X1 [Fukomys damarensis]|uniref:centromere protein X isoform X1 n=1 Tax=Fukomys damarensis TaxID=885580 RepID=UPI00145512E3|nr:centromere protein X isoform X1 [Fukomys damarensis]
MLAPCCLPMPPRVGSRCLVVLGQSSPVCSWTEVVRRGGRTAKSGKALGPPTGRRCQSGPGAWLRPGLHCTAEEPGRQAGIHTPYGLSPFAFHRKVRRRRASFNSRLQEGLYCRGKEGGRAAPVAGGSRVTDGGEAIARGGACPSGAQTKPAWTPRVPRARARAGEGAGREGRAALAEACSARAALGARPRLLREATFACAWSEFQSCRLIPCIGYFFGLLRAGQRGGTKTDRFLPLQLPSWSW